MRWLTYGPFPPRQDGLNFPEEDQIRRDFEKIRELGFNGIRLYGLPTTDLLKSATDCGLSLAVGPAWDWSIHFLQDRRAWRQQMLEQWRVWQPSLSHPAIELIYMANEVPADLVRLMGPKLVKSELNWLVGVVKELLPSKLVAYANYPTTEYLELDDADLTAFNVYLESVDDFANYLRRLRLLSSDRPLIISEIGADSHSLGLEKQAQLVTELCATARQLGAAGLTVYAFSDRWWNQGRLMKEWGFGIVDIEGQSKPLAEKLREQFRAPLQNGAQSSSPTLAVIICTRNGGHQIAAAIESVLKQHSPADEIIVVDDGSQDDTPEVLAQYADITVIRQAPRGLSAARNLGAERSKSEWVVYTDDDCIAHPDWLLEIRRAISNSEARAIGGPNLPPPASSLAEAINASTPGSASHVMLDDQQAEHLPGCNLAIHRQTLLDMGGFDPRFTSAGDDVDICWRLLDQGDRLAYAPDALVWHRPRPTLFKFLKQQWGYGVAENLLREKHPQRFTDEGAPHWQGVVYTSGSGLNRESTIYHGALGSAAYQGRSTVQLPLKPLASGYQTPMARWLLRVMSLLQPKARQAGRDGFFRCFLLGAEAQQAQSSLPFENSIPSYPEPNLPRQEFLNQKLAEGWEISTDERWDLERDGEKIVSAEERFQDGSTRLIVRQTFR